MALAMLVNIADLALHGVCSSVENADVSRRLERLAACSVGRHHHHIQLSASFPSTISSGDTRHLIREAMEFRIPVITDRGRRPEAIPALSRGGLRKRRGWVSSRATLRPRGQCPPCSSLRKRKRKLNRMWTTNKGDTDRASHIHLQDEEVTRKFLCEQKMRLPRTRSNGSVSRKGVEVGTATGAVETRHRAPHHTAEGRARPTAGTAVEAAGLSSDTLFTPR